MSRLLGGLRPAPFLRRHWQREPLFVPGAFPGLRPPVTPSVLFELACRADVESRLVLERGGQRPWEVVHGPQDPRRLGRLPKTHWTLLVQGVDRLLPAVAALTRPFRFLPDWRIDDVMVSFAAPQGSVGPHVDSYDVFLLQGLGQRRWAISTRTEPAFRSGLDLRILRRFQPEESRVLGPGDMLYLPPGVGHHGVALEDGLTFSIGFRAPSGRELLAATLRARGVDALYRDPVLRPARHPGEITPAALRGLRRLAREALDRGLETAIGELVTEPKGEPVEARRPRPSGGRPKAAEGSGPRCGAREHGSPSCGAAGRPPSSRRGARSRWGGRWPSRAPCSAAPSAFPPPTCGPPCACVASPSSWPRCLRRGPSPCAGEPPGSFAAKILQHPPEVLGPRALDHERLPRDGMAQREAARVEHQPGGGVDVPVLAALHAALPDPALREGRP